MKVASLFAGIGGFDLALTRLGHEIVYVNEWDKYAAQTYEKNFGIKPDTRDIKTVPTSDIPDHDFLVGGFPCQSFSIAGKRRGFDDTRGTMFFEIARILRDKRPRYFILENVKGLLNHDQGKTFQTILGVLTDLGYEYQWQVLNSKNFGIPQNRERVLIVGNLRGTGRPQVFPIRSDNPDASQKDRPQTANTLTATYWKGPAANRPFVATKDGNAHTLDANYYKGLRANQARTGVLQQVIGGSQGYRVYDPEGVSTTLASEGGGAGAKTGLYAIPVLTPDRIEKRQNGRRFKTEGEPMFTLNTQDKHGIYDGVKIRRLTPVECERLQGFPDGWTEGVSDTQRYKQLGNAVTVNVVYEVARRTF